MRSGEHKTFMESTKSMVLLGTSKWFAKIIVKGWNLNGVTLCRIVLKLNTFVVNVVVGQLCVAAWKLIFVTVVQCWLLGGG